MRKEKISSVKIEKEIVVFGFKPHVIKRGQSLINEINHTLEFHSAQPVTQVDIAGLIVDYTIKKAKEAEERRAQND